MNLGACDFAAVSEYCSIGSGVGLTEWLVACSMPYSLSYSPESKFLQALTWTYLFSNVVYWVVGRRLDSD